MGRKWFSKANRSFTTYVYHEEKVSTEWEVHLYVLPEEAAEKLVSWIKRTDALVKAGQKDKIESFDASLTDEAIHVVTRKYYLATD